jgi:site-specific recombinase XerD
MSTTMKMPPAWLAALDAYEAACRDSVSSTELRVRMARLSRFASDVRTVVAEVTPTQVELWVGSLTAATASDYVKSVRLFYEWAVREGRCRSNPTPARAIPRHYTLDAKWRDGIEAFERFERESKIAPATVIRRVKHVRRFASTVSMSPWLVTADDYRVWIESLGVGDSTMRAMRDSMRAFYRWALREGRIAIDPTMEPNGRYRTLDVPQHWEMPLRQYRSYLVGRGLAPTTVRLHIDLMRNFARDHASAEPFAVTTDDIFEYFAGKSWKRETMRSRRQAARSFYGWARITGRCDVDPTENMPVIRAGDLTARPATDEEYAQALRSATDPRWLLALRLGYEMGLRRTEIAQIHSSDITVDAQRVHWLTVHGKGGKDRRLPIPDRLLPLIRERDTGYLFPSPHGGHVTPRHLGKVLSSLLPAGVTAHALRHAFATRLYNVNSDVFSVQQLLGHASAATTQRYVHVAGERLRTLINTPLDDLVEVMSR